MICENNDRSPVSIDFEKGGELYPNELSYETSADGFDTLICRFNSETASLLENREIAGLDTTQKATFKIEGEPAKEMYFEPSFLNLGEKISSQDSYGELELHDLHENLKTGIIDYAPQETTVEKVYRKIFEAARNSEGNLINDFEINVDNSNSSLSEALELTRADKASNLLSLGVSYSHKKDETLDIDYNSTINFDAISPLKALKEANKKLSLSSHITSDGTLVVGQYNSDYDYAANKVRGTNTHLTKSVSVSGAHSDLKKLVVEGGTKQVPTGIEEDAYRDNLIEYLNPFDDAGGRARAKVVVTTDNGSRKEKISAHDLPFEERDLVQLAKRAFISTVSSNPSGKIVLDFVNGKSSNLSIGDKILIQEPDSCGDLVEPSYSSNRYIITGIQHRYNSGSWEVALDVINNYTDKIENLQTSFSYIDVSTQNGINQLE